MCLNGIWGSICNQFWDNEDASVVCKQLGYSPYGIVQLVSYIFTTYTGAIASSAVYYTSSSLIHNIIDLNCTGNESNIFSCPYNGYTSYSCSLGRDANVFCKCKYIH